MSSIGFSAFRERVDQILSRGDSVLIKTLYLTASRVSEILTKVNPSELELGKTKAYGIYLKWDLQDFEWQGRVEKALCITEAVAKRKRRTKSGKSPDMVYKVIALPTSQAYEPWSLDLLEYLLAHKTLSFDLTRKRVWQIVKNNLGDLDPDIHPHSLRHYRLTHLVTEYGFTDPFSIAYIAGWTFKTTLGNLGMASASGQLDVYLHMAWRNYFPKLLKPISSIMMTEAMRQEQAKISNISRECEEE